jgi:hypothetical protein
MAAEGDAADSLVSVQGFRQHYTKIRERMVRQTTAGVGASAGEHPDASTAAAAGGGVQLAVQPPASSPASLQPRLDISDLRTLSTYEQVEQRIANRMARLAAQASEAKAAAAAAEAAVRAAASGPTSPRSKRFEELKKCISKLTPEQVAAMDAAQRRDYNRLVAKLQAKDEGDRRLRAEQKRKAELASRRHKQAAAAAASLAATNPETAATVSELAPGDAAGAAAADHNNDSNEARRIGTSHAARSGRLLGSDEVILTVRVFFHGRGAASPAQELEVLSSQPLNVLVDQISCLYDRPEVYSRHSWCDAILVSTPILCKQ